jgi:hypothetical protein
MIQEFLRRLMRVEGFDVGTPDPAIDRAKEALAEAKARRLEIDATDPRRLADLEIQQRQDALDTAERERLDNIYTQLQSHGSSLVLQYRQTAALFDEHLAQLVGIVRELSALTRAIEALRSELWNLSRPLQRADTGLEFQPRELLTTAVASLQRAWRQGQADG